jgi:hypothetical protein
MPKDYLPELLNRAEAMIDCGAGTIAGLAEYLMPEQAKRQATTRVSEWIRSRTRNPNGETALRLQEWAAARTLEIVGNRGLAKAYRKAFSEVKERRK